MSGLPPKDSEWAKALRFIDDEAMDKVIEDTIQLLAVQISDLSKHKESLEESLREFRAERAKRSSK